MAQQDINQRETFSAILSPDERKVEACMRGVSRVMVKKINDYVYVIIQDDDGSHCMISANTYKALYEFAESILLLISIAEGL